MTILERIQSDVKDAMRARDTERTTALRMLVNALQMESKNRKHDLDDVEEIAVMSRERKKRIEAAEAFESAGADDRAALERAQLTMIEAYLPEQMDAAEIQQLVAAAIAETGADSPAHMGQVMKALKPKVQGRADGKTVSDAVRAALADMGA